MSGSMKAFQKQALLGKGSFGSVFKAKRKTDGHLYAIKEVNIRNLSSRERQDAVNEIRILASIKHTNIVRYCEAFVEGDNLYIVMEFAERGDIDHIIKKAKKKNAYIPEDTIWCYLLQICYGLQHLHHRNILHRDLKPKNIFLTAEKHVRIGDLGCAKLMKTKLTRTQVGTPYYMAPEIWSKRPYDAKCDVWALGCILHELCTLSPPFLANDMNGLAKKVQTARTPRISKRYSDDLAGLISRMLSKSVSSRPTIDEIFSMPSVSKRLKLAPKSDNGGRWQNETRTSKILNTIKSPCYPVRRLYTSPGKPRRRKGSLTARSSPARLMTSPPGRRIRKSGVSPPKLRLPSVPSTNKLGSRDVGAGAGAGSGAGAAARGGIVSAREHRGIAKVGYYKAASKYAKGKENGRVKTAAPSTKYKPRQPTAPSRRYGAAPRGNYRRVHSRLW